ncbi:DNA transporter HofQ [Yersinia ruckeri]|uniref:DNA uptake porin HofQ n=1 Tax=Yersinia ruckeri TaxID=29486 RepID=UPI0008FDA5F5|nr:DNA uptake porin HofQ [Yersinia ruckeri]OJC35098.1 DNA transporter HofQ [Yersinia ruckeri]
MKFSPRSHGVGIVFLLLYCSLCRSEQSEPPVSLVFQNAPVSAVLQSLADYKNLNLVASANVGGNLSLRLVDVPWQQALDTVLRMGNLTVEREGNLLLVLTEQEVATRFLHDQGQREKKAKHQVLDRHSQVLLHAEAEEIAANLNVNHGGLLSPQGRVFADKRTNRLLIRDTAESIAALKAWLSELDSPLQQVQLAAHIVTISSESLHELGVRWGIPARDSGGSALRINNFNVGLPIQNSAITAGFNIARISGQLLDLELSALEQENQVEIIASPRLTTSHQQTASIKQGTDIPYSVSSGKNGGTTVEFKEAVLGMEVTPRILGAGKITLKLKISQNMPGMAIKRGENESLAIDKQEIKTQITVNDGETIVLGGIFQQKNSRGANKVPVLSDIPLLGHLFKQTVNAKSRRELVIFITPRLISI